MKTSSRWIALMLGALVLVGCQRPYVNIPAQAGDVATHDPNGSMVREVLPLALSKAVEETPVQGPVEVVLPENTSQLTYAAMLPKISDRAVAPDDEQAAQTEATLTTKAVRIRGTVGQVDVTQKIGDQPAQLMTVYLKWSAFGGWTIQRVRQWTGAVN